MTGIVRVDSAILLSSYRQPHHALTQTHNWDETLLPGTAGTGEVLAVSLAGVLLSSPSEVGPAVEASAGAGRTVHLPPFPGAGPPPAAASRANRRLQAAGAGLPGGLQPASAAERVRSGDRPSAPPARPPSRAPAVKGCQRPLGPLNRPGPALPEERGPGPEGGGGETSWAEGVPPRP